MGQTVSIVIATSASRDYYLSCLESIRLQKQPPFEVILINNSLEPEVSRKALDVFPALKVIMPECNLYYGRAMNAGIQLSRGEFVLCLNDDAFLEPDFLAEALKGFELPDVGMVSGKILRLDRRTIDSTGLELSLWRTARERGYGRTDTGQYNVDGDVFGVSGAAALYRKAMLDQIGGFDGSFKMFYEDLDLAWRARRLGWKGYYLSRAQVYHARGGSVRPDGAQAKPLARRFLSDEFHAQLIRNRYKTILKNHQGIDWVLYLAPMMAYEIAAWAYVIVFSPGVIRYLLSR